MREQDYNELEAVECDVPIGSRSTTTSESDSVSFTEPKTKWAVGRSGSAFWATHDVVDEISPGLYHCQHDNSVGPLLLKMTAHVDDLVTLPDEDTWKITEQIKQFWNMKSSFSKRGFLHKRGILMYGDPGSGKTTAIQLIIRRVIEMGGIALFPTEEPDIFSSCLRMIRTIEKDIPIVAILEDFDTIMNNEYRQNQWLSILDGESQTDNIVFIATTNYIDRIDKRFTDRPSRFDVIQPIPMPSAMSRAIFIHTKEPSLSVGEIEEWVSLTKGMSIAHIKEVIISVKCYGHSLIDTIKRLKKMQSRSYNMLDANDNGKHIGFVVPNTDEHFCLEDFLKYMKVKT